MTMPHEQIPEERCWELLATTSVGRLALSVQALPVIVPVQYYLEQGRSLVVCLGHRQLSERVLNETIIAFAADAIDPATRAGWSIQIQGRSTIPQPPNLDLDTACGKPTAWQLVRIEPSTITGYHMHLCPFIDALLAAGTGPRVVSE